MLEKLLKYPNFGNQQQLLFVVNNISKSSKKINDLKKICLDSDYSFGQSFDGVIALLNWLNILKVEDTGYINLGVNINNVNLNKLTLKCLFIKISANKALHHLFSLNGITINKDNEIFINNNFIPLKFSSIRNLLINIDFLKKDDLIANQFFINKKYLKWFYKHIIPLIEKSYIKNNSLQKLKRIQANQEELGKQAEEFVLAYEKRRRKNHKSYNKIEIISDIDTSAGYDVRSYINDSSIILDKLIEVKSYSGNINFYWSRNEVNTAKNKRENYFLYLIDRDKIKCGDYSPTIIKNPYKNIFENSNWNKECQNWYFSNKLVHHE